MRSTGLREDVPGELVKMIDGILYRKGDKVKLNLGKRRSDTLDTFLNGRVATIEVIHTDYEDKVHVAVTMNDDPGQDLQRELGIYLYFSPDEIELIK
ncbi:MAG: hypothetical protein ACXVNN_06560 [Bacteroidia bacterium]